ncbi:MAG TPA: hypothetical protein PKE06_20515 [Flavilitoribacter sp.]|nr:hypothetical protein [Flavilitoribacter sp.]HMQ91363.1 hypothetical protein [Flavilitoribacter sp.]
MEKRSARTVLLTLIGIASFLSYLYLQRARVADQLIEEDQITIEEVEVGDDFQQEVHLPDVQMIQKLVETGKRLIPGS